jgi:hypothetical protein
MLRRMWTAFWDWFFKGPPLDGGPYKPNGWWGG